MEYFPKPLKPYLAKRCQLTKLYQEYLEIITEELTSEGIEYYVFKTIKPFAYDMTDIDILITDKKELSLASRKLMKNHGFKVISKGTYSITLRKTINGLDIDLDLQTRIAAGTFEYVAISDLRRQVKEIGCIKNGLSLLRPELELNVVIGHTFYKDFAISIANILYARHLLRRIDKHYLSLVFDNHRYLVRPFKLLNYIITIFQEIFNVSGNSEERGFQRSKEYLFIMRNFYRVIRGRRGILSIPLVLVAGIYGETMKILMEDRRYRQLREIINLPRSRGVKLLFRRIGFLPPEETIRV